MSKITSTIPNPPLSLLGKKIVWSTLVQYAGRIGQLLIATIATKLLSGFLSQENYGFYGQITEFALFVTVAANLGIHINIIRKMADAPKDSKIFINGLFLRIFTSVIFFVPAVLYLIFTGSDQLFVIATVLLFGSLFFDLINSVCAGMLQANYLMGRATIALLVGRAVHLTGIFIIVSHLGGAPIETIISSIFLSAMAGSIITAILSLNFVRQKIQWQWKIDRNFLREIFWTSLPLGLVNVINALYFRFLPDYFANEYLTQPQFATFNISFHIAQVLSLLSTFLMLSVLPGLKEYIDKKHWQKVSILLKRVWQFIIISGILVTVFGSLFGATMIELITHKKYFLPELWFILPMMSLLAAISYGYDVVLVSLFAAEKDWWLVGRELISLSVSLIFFFSSAIPTDITTKIVLVILGAIAGELTMLVLGMFKVRRVFKTID